MKKETKIIALTLTLLMFLPFKVVKAESKTEQLLERLEELVEIFDGTLTYEDDLINIEWFITNSESNSVSFSYDGNVIEYSVDEIENYEEAKDVISHSIYALRLITSALSLNGYSDNQIQEFFSSDTNEFNYDINGIEMNVAGESNTYTSSDGTSSITISPVSIKVDVARANLNTDSSIDETSTTIEDVVNNLQSDSDFVMAKDEDEKVIFENEIIAEDGLITINNTSYTYDYHNVLIPCENDIITYEDDEFDSYETVESAESHHLFLMQIIMEALKMNGYTTEQIQEFTLSEDNSFDYETNGIEYKEIGEEVSFTNEFGSTVSDTPMSIKIDLARANLNTVSEEENTNENESQETPNYKVLDVVNNDKELTFRFNIDYSKFKENGKVYIDGSLVDAANYTSKEGSTIITFNSDYVKTLSNNEHTLKVVVADGEVETKFTKAKEETATTSNPKTSDNIMNYVSMLGLSIIGLIGAGLYIRKNKLFN
ncbi:MAG: hypothetical protein IJ574_01145 [Bacilli bacterium]|nr:hypothetical protein [Bacilli bacterium]